MTLFRSNSVLVASFIMLMQDASIDEELGREAQFRIEDIVDAQDAQYVTFEPVNFYALMDRMDEAANESVTVMLPMSSSVSSSR